MGRLTSFRLFAFVGILCAWQGSVRAQTAVWIGPSGGSYSAPGNWQGNAVPANDGTVTIDFSDSGALTPAGSYYEGVSVDTPAVLHGLTFLGTSGESYYSIYPNGGSLTLGAGGITTAQVNLNPYFSLSVPIILSAPQVWNLRNGVMWDYGNVSETGGSQSLSTSGAVVLDGTNTFSGGLTVVSGYLYLGSNSAGSGTLTLSDGTALYPWSGSVSIPNAVQLGNNVTIGSGGYPAMTLSGTVTAANTATTLKLEYSSTVVLSGTFAGPSASTLTVTGGGPYLPADGGSLLVMQGALGVHVSGIDVEDAALILAPTGSVESAFPNFSTLALQVGSGPLSQGAYLGLDGTFSTSGEVSSFLSMFGTTLGHNINGTLGFDSFANPAAPKIFPDPIDLTNFSSLNFIGLGSATAATLGPYATITPYNNTYMFGGGGGTLNVKSPLADNGVTPRSLTMTAAPEPVTVLLQGGSAYSGPTTSRDGVLIFDSAVPSSSTITLNGGYVGYTENAANISIAQNFVSLFGTTSPNGVMGFDSTNPASPRTVADPINLSAFTSSSGLFLGTATAVTLLDSITPAGATYQLTGVKGGQLTVNSVLSGAGNSVVVGLPNALEANGSVSSVTLGGINTYAGGTTLNTGILYVTNSSSLGTGLLSVENNPVLAPLGVPVTLPNPIKLDSYLTLGQSGNSNLLTLGGVISGTGGLELYYGSIALNGANTFTGSTYIYDSAVAVGNASGLGSGQVNMGYNSTLNVTATNPTIVDLTGDYTGESAPRINLAPSSTLTLNTDSYYVLPSWASFSGSINGDAGSQVIKTGPGAEYLYGNSTYGGGTTVSAGVLVAGGSASLGTGTVTVASGAALDVTSGVAIPNSLNFLAGSLLGGNGTVSSATFASGAIVEPGMGYGGQYMGTLSFSTVTFGTGGIFDFNVQNDPGAAGTDYDTLSVSGALSISATHVSPFVISVISINPLSGSPGLATFDPSHPYSWTLVSAGSISGFDPLDFSVNTGGFQNPLAGGSFTIGETGSNLTLNFTPVPEPSTWILMLSGLAAAGTGFLRRKRH
jgi:autotransporter-associated beta strand protein